MRKRAASMVSMRVINWICNLYLTVIREREVVQAAGSCIHHLRDLKQRPPLAVIASASTPARMSRRSPRGILSIDNGQFEAGARSLQLRSDDVLHHLPQMFRRPADAVQRVHVL